MTFNAANRNYVKKICTIERQYSCPSLRQRFPTWGTRTLSGTNQEFRGTQKKMKMVGTGS